MSIRTHIGRVIGRFPVEAALSMTFYLLMVLVLLSGKGAGVPHIEILFIFFPAYVVTFTIGEISYMPDKGKLWRWFYYLSYFFWVPFLWIDEKSFFSSPCLPVSYIIATLLLVMTFSKSEDTLFCRRLVTRASNIIAAFVAGGIVALLSLIVMVSVKFLLGIAVTSETSGYIFGLIAFFIIPLLSCKLVTDSFIDAEKLIRVLSVLFRYIITPFLALYTLLLYIYLIKILILWELPKGEVAYIVGGFLSVSLVCRMIAKLFMERADEKRGASITERAYNLFPFIAVPHLILLWMAVMCRVAQYGITPERFYLMLTALILSFSYIALMLKLRCSFSLTVRFAASSLFLFTYIPGISAQSISVRSQYLRFKANEEGAKEYLIQNLSDKKCYELGIIANEASDDVYEISPE